MSGVYHWAMRRGAGILFVVSILILLIGLWTPITGLFALTSEMAGSHYYSPTLSDTGLQWQMLFQSLLTAIEAAALPFIGALAIDRLDRHWFPEEKAE